MEMKNENKQHSELVFYLAKLYGAFVCDDGGDGPMFARGQRSLRCAR